MDENRLWKIGGISFPSGVFQRSDIYLYRRWKQVQQDLFWVRWKKEYIPLLQKRNKWVMKKESFRKGDLVMVVDDMKPRNIWNLGRIVKIIEDEDKEVRVVEVRVNKDKNSLDTIILKRPITKLILLKRNHELF